MRRELLCAALVAIGVIGIAPATARARPVSPRLLEFLKAGPIAFKPAGMNARPGISAAVASRDAAREVQWRPARPLGATLVRMGAGAGVNARTPAWLVALTPRHPLYDRAGAPPANYMVAFVRADDGRLVGDAAGYSPDLAGRTPGSSWGIAELSGPAPN